MPVNNSYVNAANKGLQQQKIPVSPNMSKLDVKNKLANFNEKYLSASTPQQKNRIQNRVNYLANKYNIKNNPFNANQPQATSPDATSGPNVAVDDMMLKFKKQSQPANNIAATNSNALFNNYNDSYDYYANQGIARLNKLRAAQGLTGSSANIQGQQDFLTELGAKSAADKNVFNNINSDRLWKILTDTANMNQQTSNSAWSKYQDMLNYGLKAMPPELAYAASKDAMDATINYGDKKSGNIKDLYQKYSGGGGGGAGAFIPPFASGPDFTNIDLIGMMNSAGGNSSYLDEILKGAGTLIGGLK